MFSRDYGLKKFVHVLQFRRRANINLALQSEKREILLKLKKHKMNSKFEFKFLLLIYLKVYYNPCSVTISQLEYMWTSYDAIMSITMNIRNKTVRVKQILCNI